MRVLSAFNLFSNEKQIDQEPYEHIGYDPFAQQSIWAGNSSPTAGRCTYTSVSPPRDTSRCTISTTTYGCTIVGTAPNSSVSVSCD
jgi:hypothetical protein